MLADPGLPQRAALLGDEAAGLLAAALAPGGVEVASARPTQVRYEPGRRIVVRYATQVREGGSERVDTLVAIAGGTMPDGVALLTDPDGHEVGVWRYPNDPFLPGLRTLVYPEGARHVLAQLGAPSPAVRVRPLVYRPGQRAVLRIDTGSTTLYAKLVRPKRAEGIHRRHRALEGRAPVPRSLGWAREYGLVVLEERPGVPFGDDLTHGAKTPPPEALLTLLDRIAGAEVDGPGTPRPLASYAGLLRTVLPAERATVDALERYAAGATLSADRTVHGDFYEKQVLVRAGAVTALLDVDGARRGDAVEDLATLIGHLDGLAHVRPAAATRILDYRRALQRLATSRRDAETLAAAVAGVLLGLATTPFRVQQDGWPARTRGWLGLARRWLPTSWHEEALMPESFSPHEAGAA